MSGRWRSASQLQARIHQQVSGERDIRSFKIKYKPSGICCNSLRRLPHSLKVCLSIVCVVSGVQKIRGIHVLSLSTEVLSTSK